MAGEGMKASEVNDHMRESMAAMRDYSWFGEIPLGTRDQSPLADINAPDRERDLRRWCIEQALQITADPDLFFKVADKLGEYVRGEIHG